MTRPALIPHGCWPARMPADIAAAYVGERSAEAFEKRVGTEYPRPAVDDGAGKGRRRLWLRRDLDQAIDPAGAIGADPPEVA